MKAKNTNLNKAKKEKNDEFYTLLEDIEKEIGGGYLEYNPDLFKGKTVLCPCDDPTWSNFTLYFIQNFEKLGLKRLISSCYANPDITGETRGKVYILEQGDPIPTNLNDIHYHLLDGDGSFRSDEITRFRDSADFVITNPPFSLSIDFVTWLIESNCKFSFIGNKNHVVSKAFFPLIKNNKMWSGSLKWGSMNFIDHRSEDKTLKSIPAIWYTNIEFNRKTKPLELLTMQENLDKNPNLIELGAYLEYENYNAIEVPRTEAIPSDYDGVMGVPISFLDKYDPNQFEIVGVTTTWFNDPRYKKGKGCGVIMLNGVKVEKYSRILIKHKKPLAQN